MQPIQLLIQTSDLYLVDAAMADFPKHGVIVEELLLYRMNVTFYQLTVTTSNKKPACSGLCFLA